MELQERQFRHFNCRWYPENAVQKTGW